jgi:hypothetical protein
VGDGWWMIRGVMEEVGGRMGRRRVGESIGEFWVSQRTLHRGVINGPVRRRIRSVGGKGGEWMKQEQGKGNIQSSGSSGSWCIGKSRGWVLEGYGEGG